MNSQKAMTATGIIMILLSALVYCIWVFMPQYRLALAVVFAIPGYALTGGIIYAWLKQPANYGIARSVYQDHQKEDKR